jgi:hypothetical protein
MLAAHAVPAAPDRSIAPAAALTSNEVIVFEAPRCGHCAAFRDRLGASYAQSAAGRTAPMRYIDVTRVDLEGYGLNADIVIVPTIVMMREGREVGRIEGYPVPALLFGLVRESFGE